MWRLEVETRGVEQVESRVFLAGLDQNLQPVGGDNSPTMFSPSVRLPWLLYDVERIFQIVDGCHSTAHPGPALEVDVKPGESVLNHVCHRLEITRTLGDLSEETQNLYISLGYCW